MEIQDFGYKKLIAWQKADELAHGVYDLTLSFPKTEQFGLTSQLQRAILSVPTNIVEGYLLEFAHKRRFISEANFQKISLLKEEVGRIIWKLFVSQK